MSESDSTSAPEIVYKDIPGFPDYRVGSDGTIWSCRVKGCNIPKIGPWKRLAIYRRTYGARYCTVGLRPIPGGKLTLCYVHRLMLEAFIGPCPDGMEVCHNDRNTANNTLENLRWDTRVNNLADQLKHGTRLCGSRNPAAKLTEDDVRSIRQLYRSGEFSQQELGHLFGIEQTTVSGIIRRDQWQHVD